MRDLLWLCRVTAPLVPPLIPPQGVISGPKQPPHPPILVSHPAIPSRQIPHSGCNRNTFQPPDSSTCSDHRSRVNKPNDDDGPNDPPPTLPRELTISLSHHQSTLPTNPQTTRTRTRSSTSLSESNPKSENLSLVSTRTLILALTLPNRTRMMASARGPRAKMKKSQVPEATFPERRSALKNSRHPVPNWWTRG